MIMMYQRRLISYNKCTNLVGDVDSDNDVLNVSTVIITSVPLWWGMLIVGQLCKCGNKGYHVLSTQFCCESKTALKNKFYF